MSKQEILTFLSDAEDFVSGEELCGRLSCTRANVWKHIKALRSDGYEIDSQPGRGYRLRSCPDSLDALLVLKALGEHPWRENVQVLKTVDSTNTQLKALAVAGAAEGTVIVADSQSAGRGRLGRSFSSPAGEGIYLSVLLRPDCRPDELTHLTCMAAVAVCDAIEAVCGVCPDVKWINDLLLNGKKLCGILTELSIEGESGRVSYAVIGVGVNCGQTGFPGELGKVATSLLMETGRPVDRSALAAEIIRRLERMSKELLTKKDKYMERYKKLCVTLGRQVRLISPAGEENAFALDTDETGALLVRLEDGSLKTVGAGEVSVRGLCGYA